MPTIPAPTLIISREEWPDADFDLSEGVPITSSDKDEDNEDWDIEMNLGQTGGAKIQSVIAGMTARSELTNSVSSQSHSSSIFTIRPPIISSGEEDEDEEEEGVSTIKAIDTLKTSLQTHSPSEAIDEDFEDGFSLPSDLSQLSLAPLSLHHRSSKNSLEWGDRDQTSSSQSSDAYSTLGFADASPSSNSASSVSSFPETETEDDEEQDDLDGLVIPAAIFDSGSSGKQLNKILEVKKKASYITRTIKVAAPDPEDDFEAGLVFDDDADLSPSRLLQNTQSQRPLRRFDRSSSAPLQRTSSASLRPSSRIRSERAKSPSGPPPSSVRQLQKLRLSPSPPLQPPPRSQTSFGILGRANTSDSPSPSPGRLVSKPGSLRGQKSHTGLKPPTPPATRKLARKASLSSLMEMSHANAPESAPGPSKSRIARYEVPTTASLAKAHKISTTKLSDYPVPPTRPHTPSSNSAALRLTMPTQLRSKSRPALSQVFAGTSAAPVAPLPKNRTGSPVVPLPRPPSTSSLRPSSSRLLKASQSSNPSPSSPVTPPAPKILKRPKRPKTYGDGTELDGFDDLPTNRDKENQYRVQPKGYGNRIPSASHPSETASPPSVSACPDAKATVRKKKKRAGSVSTDTGATLAPPSNTLRRSSTRIDFSSKINTLPPAEPLPKKKKTGSPLSQSQRKPTLIRNLGGVGASKVIGDMKWNPQSLRWEGNDQALKDFEAAIATSTRPALITHLTGSSIGSPVGSFASGARRVGNMIFDPQRMCWISALSPEEEEPDVFANLADDENELDGDLKGGTIRVSIQRAPSDAGSTNTSTTISQTEPPSPARSLSLGVSDSESDRGSRASLVVCDIDDAFVDACRAAEERHRQEMKGWRSTLSRYDIFSEIDRSHLYEIRALATRRY